MATLALSVAGASLGSLSGLGAGTGWQIGSTLGRVFFPGDEGRGSRLSDLKVSGASYGASIPTIFGTMRLAGNVIWAAPLISKPTTSEAGGKGGVSGSGGQTAYEYFADFALSLATGEVGELLKIWADGTLIYDVVSASETRSASLNFRFYNGDENQLPDSIMEADLGTGQVPAYRGLSYLVFDHLPLSNFGNRIPNIEVLISNEGVRHYPQQTGTSGYVDVSAAAYDLKRGLIYTYEVTGGVNKVRKIDLASLAVLQTADIGTEFPELPTATSGFSMDRNGDFWIGTGFGLMGERKISRFNSRAMKIEADKDLPGDVGATTFSVDIISALTGESFQIAGSQQNSQVVVFDTNLEVVDTVAVSSTTCSGSVRDETETAWIAMSGLHAITPKSNLQVVELSMTASQKLTGVNYSSQFIIHTISQPDLTPLGSALPEVNNVTRLVGYLSTRRELVFQNDYRLFKWSMDSHVITATRDETGLGSLSLVHSNDGDSLVYLDGGRWLVYLNAETLQEREREDLFAFSGVSSANVFVHDAQSDSLLLLDPSEPLTRLYLRRTNGADADLDETLEALTLKAGLSIGDIDLSAVSGSVLGYILNRPMPVQEALKPLMTAGDLDICESGYQLKFFPKKETVDLSLSEEDLLKPLAQKRLQESELPGSVSLSYMAADGGHLAGAQSAKRHYAPNATMFGRNEVALELPLSLNADQAKAICRRSLFTAWSERQSLGTSLPLKYLALDAADLVTITKDGRDIKSRITQHYLGADLSLDIEMVEAGNAPISATLPADTGSGYADVLIQRPAFSELFILDLPLLRDEDATAGVGSRYYYAMDGYGQNWRGAGLFVSPSGERFEQKGVTQFEACHGVTLSALGSSENPWQTDRENSVFIRFLKGQDRLESISELDALNGGNALLVGDEIINFSDLNQQGDGSFEIKTLLRGRRGTESAISDHRIGEPVVLLEANRLSANIMPLASLNLPHHWKAVGAGQLLEDVPAQIKALSGRDLMPYAPVQISVQRTPTNADISWVRRSRLAGAGLSLSPPLAETSERYELVFEYGGKSISKFVFNESTYTYSLTTFNEDFLASNAEMPELELTLYQLSDAIGRGLPAKETL